MSSMAPSYMSGNAVQSPTVDSNVLIGNELILGGSKAVNISQNYLDDSNESLPASAALYEAFSVLKTAIDNLSLVVDYQRIIPLISEPVISPMFIEERGWMKYRFIFDQGKAKFWNQNYLEEVQAYLRIPQELFPSIGVYFVEVTVEKMDSGRIEVRNQAGTLIRTITEVGVTAFEVDIPNVDIAYLEFQVHGSQNTHETIISTIYVHYVRNIIDKYLEFKAQDLLSGGTGFATVTYVNASLDTFAQNLRAYTNSVVGALGDAFVQHVDQPNPHGTSAADVGAAEKVHTHTPEECSAAPVVHTHSPGECGAAPINHTHTPQEIGAAPQAHTHTPNECGSVSTSEFTTEVARLYQAIANSTSSAATVQENLDTHANNISNPHKTDYAQVGAAAEEHTHEGSDIAIPDMEFSTPGVIVPGVGLQMEAETGIVSVVYGSEAETACVGNDPRLSDARTPVAHSHTLEELGLIKQTSTFSLDPQTTQQVVLDERFTELEFLDVNLRFLDGTTVADANSVAYWTIDIPTRTLTVTNTYSSNLTFYLCVKN